MKWPFFGAIGFLRKCTLKVRYILLTYVHTPKKTAKIPLEIGSRFETYFSWSSKTGPCIFLDQAKYRAKYSYLWHRETGLSGTREQRTSWNERDKKRHRKTREASNETKTRRHRASWSRDAGTKGKSNYVPRDPAGETGSQAVRLPYEGARRPE